VRFPLSQLRKDPVLTILNMLDPYWMPSDLRQPAPSRSNTSSRTLRFFLIGFVGALYALLALKYSLPPANWMESLAAKVQEQRILQARPALQTVERCVSFFPFFPFLSRAYYNLSSQILPSAPLPPSCVTRHHAGRQGRKDNEEGGIHLARRAKRRQPSLQNQ
jgi:hypothetical protein